MRVIEMSMEWPRSGKAGGEQGLFLVIDCFTGNLEHWPSFVLGTVFCRFINYLVASTSVLYGPRIDLICRPRAACHLVYTVQRHGGNTARLARRSDVTLEVRVNVARIAPSLLYLGRAVCRVGRAKRRRRVDEHTESLNGEGVPLLRTGCWGRFAIGRVGGSRVGYRALISDRPSNISLACDAILVACATAVSEISCCFTYLFLVYSLVVYLVCNYLGWQVCEILAVKGRGGVVVRLFASHLGEPGSILGGAPPGFSHVGIVRDDVAGFFGGWVGNYVPCDPPPPQTLWISPWSMSTPPFTPLRRPGPFSIFPGESCGVGKRGQDPGEDGRAFVSLRHFEGSGRGWSAEGSWLPYRSSLHGRSAAVCSWPHFQPFPYPYPYLATLPYLVLTPPPPHYISSTINIPSPSRRSLGHPQWTTLPRARHANLFKAAQEPSILLYTSRISYGFATLIFKVGGGGGASPPSPQGRCDDMLRWERVPKYRSKLDIAKTMRVKRGEYGAAPEMIREKTRRPAASCCTISTPPGFESGSPWAVEQVVIVPDDAAGRRVFSGLSHFQRPCIPLLLSQSPHFTLIGSQDLFVKSRPNPSIQLNYLKALSRNISKWRILRRERFPTLFMIPEVDEDGESQLPDRPIISGLLVPVYWWRGFLWFAIS
ncbi:hypothetical protein PR048_033621 [Dryococelus australis]|uniref:Uncharacterized protein n=1 Tax=Dryococelus australis TaxID=614101 RepID=A0ABQ9G3U3_9NEOP|nr:hypothetical protein PR048_033621 [Dryococelus australis]